jgi:hypothetical protein
MSALRPSLRTLKPTGTGTRSCIEDALLHGLRCHATMSGTQFEQRRSEILAHLSHHRGQAHAVLCICPRREPPSLDFPPMQREVRAPDMPTSTVSAGCFARKTVARA